MQVELLASSCIRGVGLKRPKLAYNQCSRGLPVGSAIGHIHINISVLTLSNRDHVTTKTKQNKAEKQTKNPTTSVLN